MNVKMMGRLRSLWVTAVLVLTACSTNASATPDLGPTSTPQTAETQTVPASTDTRLSPTTTPAAPGQGNSVALVSGIEVKTPNLAPFEKFEIQFDLETQAVNPNLPFDASPPPGLKPGLGVSVDVLFTPDEWDTVYQQPAFLFQPYDHAVINGVDHFLPSGPMRWSARFTPQQPGTWGYRIRAEDSGGISYYPALEDTGLRFTVSGVASNPYQNSGFLQVSSADSRYFEFQDGIPFIGVGFNEGFQNSADVEETLTQFEQNKINFIRVWLSSAGINGSQWTSWASHHLDYDGYLPGVNFDINHTYQGGDVSMKLDDRGPCLFAGYLQGPVPVKPNASYSIWSRVKVDGLTQPAEPGDYGFVIKKADWLGLECDRPNLGEPITPPLSGSSDWTEVSGTIRTGSDQYWLDYLYLTRQNSRGGQVYIDEVRLWRTDDPDQTNLLRDPYANSHQYFDPMNAALWDIFIESAERHGVYLKLVIDEKNEWLRNRIDADGEMTLFGENNNFYASPNTKVRWLEEAWWRYLIARWGYSTAIHSFEYVNEGDPYNEYHFDAANAMAAYFHDSDPSNHMVTTSFWAAFPNLEFWSNPAYDEIDYADIHAYISTGWGRTASFLPDNMVETRPDYVYSGNASARLDGAEDQRVAIVPRGVVIQKEGEWIIRYQMKADGFSAECPNESTGGMQRIRWILDGGLYWGGMEGIVPFNYEGKDFLCSSPAGSYDWREFRSDQDRDGNMLPLETRLVVTDGLPHELSLFIENVNGSSGTAWIDEVTIIDPNGEIVKVLGQFDDTPLDEDTAWYNLAYGELWGGRSPVGAQKPLVRGEAGIDSSEEQEWNRDLLLDVDGIWLHNNVWGQVNPGGLYDLFWWATETIPETIYSNFLTYRNFMADIPLNNGYYQDLNASTSDGNLRAWGQRDDLNGRMHVWVQNQLHTWKRVVYGPAIPPVSGEILIPNTSPGRYLIQWWDPYELIDPIFLTQEISSDGSLILVLPYELYDDVAVKINKLP